jgi:uncharacterized protein DUF87
VSVPTLTFGRAAKGEIGVDLDRLIATRMLLQANSGGGKSRALRYMLEQTFGKVQQIVLDPEGEFASLREQFPYVLAGKGADTAATPTTAKLLCRKLMELGVSTVIDLYELPIGDRRVFVQRFLEELMHLPHALWHPTMIVLDEAHNFAPERSSGESASTEAVIALATQGRKRGYCLAAATQRISKLHKDVAAELLNKMIGRTGLDIDVKRAGDELGMQKDGRDVLKRLTPGEFFVYGPAISNEVTLIRTGDVVTTHPEAGAAAAAPPPPPEKVRKVLAQLADLPKEAADEARSIEDLRKVNRELEAKLRRAERGAPAPVDPDAINRAVEQAIARSRATWERDSAKQRADAVRGAKRLQSSLANVATILTTAVPQSIEQLLASLEAPSVVPSSVLGNGNSAVPHRAAAAPPPPRVQRERVSREVVPAEGVSRPQQRILDALASFEALGIERMARNTLAVMADQSPTSSGYDNNLGRLRSMGLTDYPSEGWVQLTGDGRKIARGDSPPGGVGELHESWYSKLSAPQARIVRELVLRYPEAIERAALAERAEQSPTSSGYDNNLGRLRSLGIVDYPTKGTVAATDLLFPEGLA